MGETRIQNTLYNYTLDHGKKKKLSSSKRLKEDCPENDT